jgi:hypothetical protein
MLTSIVDGSSSGSSKGSYCLRILSWIPVSRSCANLWRKLNYIKVLNMSPYLNLPQNIRLCYIKWNEETILNNGFRRQYDYCISEGIVTWCGYGKYLETSIASSYQAEVVTRNFQNTNNELCLCSS